MRRKFFVTAAFVFGMLAYVSPQYAQNAATEIDPTAAHASEGPTAGTVPKSKAKAVESEADPAPPRGQIKVFTLAHVAAADAKKILDDLYRDKTQTGRTPTARSPLRIAVDPRSNSLIMSGDNDVLQPIEALLMKLDAAEAAPKAPKSFRTFQLRNTPAEEALAALGQLELPNTKLQTGNRQNMVVATGPDKELNRAFELLGSLDKGNLARDLQVRVVWLVDSALADKDAAPVPDDLKSAVAKLAKRVGFGELKTAAQFVVKVQPSPSIDFNAAGTALAGMAMLPQPCKVNIQGALRIDDQETIHLHVQAYATGMSDDSQLCTLSTDIKTAVGHPVILGMTPISSKSSLFVIEILADDAGDDQKAEKPRDSK